MGQPFSALNSKAYKGKESLSENPRKRDSQNCTSGGGGGGDSDKCER